MHIPDQIIECQRCTNTDKLDVPAMRKEADGTYAPVNTQRPTGWLAGPAAQNEVKKGLCPTCSSAWQETQAQFLAGQIANVDKTPVELRIPLSMPVKKSEPAVHNIRPVHVSAINQHVQGEVIRPNSIPMTAGAVEKPAITGTAQNITTSRMQAHNYGVKEVAPTRLSMPATAPTGNSRVSGLLPNGGSVVTGGIVSNNMPVSSSASIKAPAGVLTHRMQIGGGMVKTSEPQPIAPPNMMAVPLGMVPQSVVQVSAPVPLPSKTAAVATPLPSSDLKIDMTDFPELPAAQ